MAKKKDIKKITPPQTNIPIRKVAEDIAPNYPVEISVTDYQIQLVELLSHGLNVTQIADKYGVSKRTIENHLELLRTKFKCANTIHLVALFLRYKLFE